MVERELAGVCDKDSVCVSGVGKCGEGGLPVPLWDGDWVCESGEVGWGVHTCGHMRCVRKGTGKENLRVGAWSSCTQVCLQPSPASLGQPRGTVSEGCTDQPWGSCPHLQLRWELGCRQNSFGVGRLERVSVEAIFVGECSFAEIKPFCGNA